MTNININISNKDAGDEYIVVFQKPTNLNEIYKTLFPVAWKVIPLGTGGKQSIKYPLDIQLIVTEHQPSYNADERNTIRDVEIGQVWRFYRRGDFNELEIVNESTVDGVLVCRNEAAEMVDIAMAKDGNPMVVKREVGEDDQAEFQLHPTLYFAYASDLEEGELITSEISTSKIYQLNLTNLKSIDIELSMKDRNTGKRQWNALHTASAS